MERTLVKTWIYTFIVTLSLCILFVHDSYVTKVYSNGYTTVNITLRQYIFEVLRWSLGVSLLVTVVAAVIIGSRYWRKKR